MTAHRWAINVSCQLRCCGMVGEYKAAQLKAHLGGDKETVAEACHKMAVERGEIIEVDDS